MTTATPQLESPTSQLPEEWRPCPNFARYEVSSYGQVRHIETHHIKSTNKYPTNKYLFVRLYDDETKKVKSVPIASLIAEAFLGPRPPGHQVDHIDRNQTNNAVLNLQWLTQPQNVKKSYMDPKRSRSGGPRRHLTPEQHQKIHELSAQGLSQVAIGKVLGISNATVSLVLSGKKKPTSWSKSREITTELWKSDPNAGCVKIARICGISESSAKRLVKRLRAEEQN